jgi:hypothetical protein
MKCPLANEEENAEHLWTSSENSIRPAREVSKGKQSAQDLCDPILRSKIFYEASLGYKRRIICTTLPCAEVFVEPSEKALDVGMGV